MRTSSAWRRLDRPSLRLALTWTTRAKPSSAHSRPVMIWPRLPRGANECASVRQDELVRILDEVTRRAEELQTQVTDLRAQRTELVTGSDTERAAREAAAARAEVQ